MESIRKTVAFGLRKIVQECLHYRKITVWCGKRWMILGNAKRLCYIFMQDGAPPHIFRPVKEVLPDVFQDGSVKQTFYKFMATKILTQRITGCKVI